MKAVDKRIDRVKNIKTVLTALVVFVLFSSCQKEITGEVDPSTPTTPATTSNVKSFTIDAMSAGGSHDVQAFNLTYDGNNRLLSAVSTNQPGDKFVYKYNTDNTYTLDVYESNVVFIHELFFLNNLSLVDSSVQYNNATDTTTEKYIYNSNKQLATLKEYDYKKAVGSTLLKTVNYTYDSNGNLIKEVEGSVITAYDYYLDLINNLSIGTSYFFQNKNLVKTTTETGGSSTPTSINYTYTFDSSNRLSSEKAVYSDGEITVTTYTY